MFSAGNTINPNTALAKQLVAGALAGKPLELDPAIRARIEKTEASNVDGRSAQLQLKSMGALSAGQAGSARFATSAAKAMGGKLTLKGDQPTRVAKLIEATFKAGKKDLAGLMLAELVNTSTALKEWEDGRVS